MDMTLDTQAAALLERAHELMNDGGKHWMQGAYSLKNEGTGALSYCAAGAILEARGSKMTESVRARALAALGGAIATKEAGALRSGDWVTIINWNDDPRRTWAEVSSMFKTAIRQLRGI